MSTSFFSTCFRRFRLFRFFRKTLLGQKPRKTFWVVRGGPGGLLGASGGGPGGLLGGPEALRGGLGGLLGGSWALLGRSWSDLLSSSILDRFFYRFWSPKGCPKGGIWGPKTEPKTTQNRSKNHLKKRSPLGSLLRPSWDDLGPILAASWALLGVKIVLWPTRRSFFQKSTFSKRSGVKTRLGTILGRFGSPKGVVLGGQKGPKRHQKRDQNDIKILIDFWIDFGPIWEAQGTRVRATCGMRGAWLDSLSSKNSKKISKTVWTRSDPSGGGG